MKILSPKHAFEEWVSTIFGILILILSLVYLTLKIFDNTLTTKEAILFGLLGAIGILFVFVRLQSIFKFIPFLGRGDTENPEVNK